MQDKTYKRAFYRIRPKEALFADLRITRIGGKEITSNPITVRVLDISPGGLRFRSALNFPLYAGMMIRFDFATCNGIISFEGSIVHKSSDQGFILYGVEFVKTPSNSKNLVALFNGKALVFNRHFIIIKF